MKVIVLLISAFALASSDDSDLSPYAGEEQRVIKSLSPEEIESLKAGAGMGFAKLAELNGFPGPKHVLELAGRLELSPTQLKNYCKQRWALIATSKRARLRPGH
jgi:hypothetical protein